MWIKEKSKENSRKSSFTINDEMFVIERYWKVKIYNKLENQLRAILILMQSGIWPTRYLSKPEGSTLARFPAVFFHNSHWYFSWNTITSQLSRAIKYRNFERWDVVAFKLSKLLLKNVQYIKAKMYPKPCVFLTLRR